MIPYHGGPITPETCARRAWSRGHAFVSFENPGQIELAASVSQSFALDNGAFTFWKRGGNRDDWTPYYDWCAEWMTHPACDWAVIPDVIDGSEQENDQLISQWPFGHAGVPVWHLNESIDRLVRLAEDWPRVALGSTQQYDVSSPSKCLPRLSEAVDAVSDEKGRPLVKLHGLRMLNPAITTRVPLASGDSTNIAQNIGMDGAWSRGTYPPATKETRVDVIRERIELAVTPRRMDLAPLQGDLFEMAP